MYNSENGIFHRTLEYSMFLLDHTNLAIAGKINTGLNQERLDQYKSEGKIEHSNVSQNIFGRL